MEEDDDEWWLPNADIGRSKKNEACVRPTYLLELTLVMFSPLVALLMPRTPSVFSFR